MQDIFACNHYSAIKIIIILNTSMVITMVFIEDREGIFDAPIDKVWKLAMAHSTEGAKIHPC